MPDVNYVDKIKFNYKYYQENILAVGLTGSGKTWRMKQILKNPNIKRFIWDESDQFDGYGILNKDLNNLTDNNYVIQMELKTQENFDRYCDIIYQNAMSWKLNNFVNVIDEPQKYVTPQDKTSTLYKIVTSLRNKGVSNIFMTPQPSMIPPYIKDNTIHVFGFQTTNWEHIEYMERHFFGESAWLMTTQDKRKKLQDEPNLSKYSCVYRNIYEDETQVWVNPENNSI